MILVRCRVISLDEVTKPFRIIMKIFILLISAYFCLFLLILLVLLTYLKHLQTTFSALFDPFRKFDMAKKQIFFLRLLYKALSQAFLFWTTWRFLPPPPPPTILISCTFWAKNRD